MATLSRGDDVALDPAPFGAEFPNLDGWATGEWWTKRVKQQPVSLDVPRLGCPLPHQLLGRHP